MQFRRRSTVSFCCSDSKKSTLSLYRWFMGAFTSDMPEIGSSSLSRDRGRGRDHHRDAANRLQSCRNHLAIRFGSFVGNGNSNNRVVLECRHSDGSRSLLMHRNSRFFFLLFLFLVRSSSASIAGEAFSRVSRKFRLERGPLPCSLDFGYVTQKGSYCSRGKRGELCFRLAHMCNDGHKQQPRGKWKKSEEGKEREISRYVSWHERCAPFVL